MFEFSWEKFHRFITVATLVVSILSVFFTLDVQSRSLEFQEKNLELMTEIEELNREIYRISNFDPQIKSDSDFIKLYSYHFQYNQNQSLEYIILRGNYTNTFNIITPHLGELYISIINYTLPSVFFFKDGHKQYTEIKFVRDPAPIPIEEGATSVEVNIPIACMYYPHPDLIPEPGTFEHFLFGSVEFEIVFHNIQTQKYIVQQVNSEIISRIDMPE